MLSNNVESFSAANTRDAFGMHSSTDDHVWTSTTLSRRACASLSELTTALDITKAFAVESSRARSDDGRMVTEPSTGANADPAHWPFKLWLWITFADVEKVYESRLNKYPIVYDAPIVIQAAA